MHFVELDARGGLAGARGLAQVHMAIVQVRAPRSRFRPLVLETARCRREHRLGAHVCALHMSPWVASMCSWHCEGRTSAWREALCHQRRVPDAHVPSHGGGSAAALASDGLRVPLLRCRVSHEPSPRRCAREGVSLASLQGQHFRFPIHTPRDDSRRGWLREWSRVT